MNDHIAKPVKPEVLYAALLRWLPDRAPPPMKAAPEPDQPDTNASHDAQLSKLSVIAGLNIDDGMRSVGDPDLYRQLLALLVEGTDAAELCTSLAAGEFTTAMRSAHSLRGVAGTLGLTGIAHLAGQLEIQLKNAKEGEDHYSIAIAAQSLKLEFQTIAAAIKRAL